jgi:hypothetical protein
MERLSTAATSARSGLRSSRFTPVRPSCRAVPSTTASVTSSKAKTAGAVSGHAPQPERVQDMREAVATWRSWGDRAVVHVA